MVALRRIYRKIEDEDRDAARFLEVLWRTAQNVRREEIGPHQEAYIVLENFYGLSHASQKYLIRRFPILEILDSYRRPPFVHTTPPEFY
ncbi:hypothetical protein COOONC_01666 [Cooperia oncophora]